MSELNKNQWKGEPVRPEWVAPQVPPDPDDQILGYQRPNSDFKVDPSVSAAVSGTIGFLTAVGWMILVIYSVNRLQPSLGFVNGRTLIFILIAAAVCGAVAVGLAAKALRWSGLLPGFLVGIGIFAICPPLTIALMCGLGR